MTGAMSMHSWGLALLGCAVAVSTAACARDGGTNKVARAALGDGTLLLPWGEAGVSFEAGGDNSRARGPEAAVFAANGAGFLVLDSLASRVIEVAADGEIRVQVAKAPRDADGMARSPQGELAFHRAVAQQIDLFSQKGLPAGSVKVPADAHEATIVHVLSQGRVMLEHPYQERYLLGSPNMPRQPESVVASLREGIAEDFGKVGYQVVVRDAGAEPAGDARLGRPLARPGAHAVLTEMSPVGEPEQGAYRYQSKDLLDLGEASSARIFGVVGQTACVVVEHVDPNATVVDVKREVVCADAAARKEVSRFAIETSRLYTPRQELMFDGKRVGQMLPTEQGLALRTVELGKVSK